MTTPEVPNSIQRDHATYTLTSKLTATAAQSLSAAQSLLVEVSRHRPAGAGSPPHVLVAHGRAIPGSSEAARGELQAARHRSPDDEGPVPEDRDLLLIQEHVGPQPLDAEQDGAVLAEDGEADPPIRRPRHGHIARQDAPREQSGPPGGEAAEPGV